MKFYLKWLKIQCCITNLVTNLISVEAVKSLFNNKIRAIPRRVS